MAAAPPSTLGAFLRKVRERTHPADVGLQATGRRRTPGLRREELALLAGVSQTYYTYLEQGRPVRPSMGVLDALAAALHLDSSERAYMIALARPDEATAPVDEPEGLARDLARLLDVVSPCPAWIINRRRDVLAANRSARALMADWPNLPAGERNVMRWLLFDPRSREVLVDWEETAKMGLARVRAGLARTPDPAMTTFVDALLSASPQARVWWDSHEILDGLPERMRFRDPQGNIIETRPAAVRPVGPSDQELMIHTPVSGTDAEERLRALEQLVA